MSAGDSTHDPALVSWVESANDPASDFPIQNLPFGRFRHDGSEELRLGVAIGDRVLDLERASFVDGQDPSRMMGLAPGKRVALRHALSDALRAGSEGRSRLAPALLAQADVEMGLPCTIGDYTDFYTSIHHATTVGKQFRPDNPLLPNYKWVPIGYHGRSSSIEVGDRDQGHRFVRPKGQRMPPGAEAPALGASQRLDYELELGAFVGAGNSAGVPIDIEEAETHVFGLVLLNDWSARDLQAWEYQPLGPFLAKNFASTISPWIVTIEALAPFRAAFAHPAGDPAPLPYLDSPANSAQGSLDIHLEVWLETERMRSEGRKAEQLSASNYRDAYWTLAQLVTHHTVNGCNLRSGDLLGTGTQSGPNPEEAGSLLELSSGGRAPITLGNGETRSFLADGDTVILRAYCEREGARRIGFGECRGTVLPAKP